jgi:sulfopyruvate decarboxylase subunit beta
MEEEVVSALKGAGIDYVLFLPCEKIKRLIHLVNWNFDSLTLSREEEGIGIAAGLYMAGRKPLMIIQSSGFGNCINALMSLTFCYQMPLPILISWRGVYGEAIEAQRPMGEKLPALLDALGIENIVFDGKNVDEIENTVAEAYEEEKVKVVLLKPDIWSAMPDLSYLRPPIPASSIMVEGGGAKYTRYEILEGLKDELYGRIVVSNIGYPSRELYSILDQPTNFYMLGSMGLALAIGLGLALAGKEAVVVEGDGSILMNPSTLFTAINSGAETLTILAIDNAAYGSTGNQRTATAKADLQILAISAGFEKTFRSSEPHEILELLKTGDTKFIHALAKPGNAEVPPIPLKALEIKERFMEAIK